MSTKTRDQRSRSSFPCSLIRTWVSCFGGSSSHRSLNKSKSKKTLIDTPPQIPDKDANSVVLDPNAVLSGGSSSHRSLNKSKSKKTLIDTPTQKSVKDANSGVLDPNAVLSGRTIQLGGKQRRRTLSFCSSTLSFEKTNIVKETCEQAMKGISPHIFTDLMNVNQCMLLNLMVPAASSVSSLTLSPSPGFLRER